MKVPLLPRLFQLLIHPHRTLLGSPAQGKFHSHAGKSQQHQADGVNQYKTATAELTCHPGKLPDISASDGTSGTQHNKAQAAAQTFSLSTHIVH